MTSTSEKRKCPRNLSSTEAPLCRREVGGERKESAQGTMHGKSLFSLFPSSLARLLLLKFLAVSQRETAKERSLHTIIGFPLRNLTASDLRKNDVTKYKSDAAKLRARILVMADLFSRVLFLPLKNYQIDFFQPKVSHGTSHDPLLLFLVPQSILQSHCALVRSFQEPCCCDWL